jgi:hypothetical protein
MVIIKYDFYFFMGETSSKNAVYTSTIQSVLENDIVLSLMAYTVMLIMRRRGGALQILEINKYISIPRVRRHDQKHVSFDR